MEIRFKEIRERSGYTQTEMANKLEMTLGNYQKYEYGNRTSVPYKVIAEFCRLCNCTPNDIFVLKPVAA